MIKSALRRRQRRTDPGHGVLSKRPAQRRGSLPRPLSERNRSRTMFDRQPRPTTKLAPAILVYDLSVPAYTSKVGLQATPSTYLPSIGGRSCFVGVSLFPKVRAIDPKHTLIWRRSRALKYSPNPTARPPEQSCNCLRRILGPIHRAAIPRNSRTDISTRNQCGRSK